MTFTGHDHVVVAVEPQFACTAEEASRECGNGCPLGGLSLFAAERSTHASHLDGHRRIRQTKKPGNNMLQFARVLGLRIDQHLVFSRNRQRHLAFKIEMLLTTDPQ